MNRCRVGGRYRHWCANATVYGCLLYGNFRGNLHQLGLAGLSLSRHRGALVSTLDPALMSGRFREL